MVLLSIVMVSNIVIVNMVSVLKSKLWYCDNTSRDNDEDSNGVIQEGRGLSFSIGRGEKKETCERNAFLCDSFHIWCCPLGGDTEARVVGRPDWSSTSQECASISSIPQNRAGTENREIRGCLLHAAVARFLVGILKLDREERGTFHNAFEKGICIMFLTAGALLMLLAAVQVGNRCVGSRSGVCGGGTWSGELALFDSVCGDRLHLFPSTLPRYLVVGLYWFLTMH